MAESLYERLRKYREEQRPKVKTEPGWEAYLDLIDSQQRKAKHKGYKGAVNLIEQYGIVGDNVMSATSTMVAHAMGAGFSYHMHTAMSEKGIEAFTGWCMMVDILRDMEMAHRARDMRLFCDGFDDLNTQIVKIVNAGR